MLVASVLKNKGIYYLILSPNNQFSIWIPQARIWIICVFLQLAFSSVPPFHEDKIIYYVATLSVNGDRVIVSWLWSSRAIRYLFRSCKNPGGNPLRVRSALIAWHHLIRAMSLHLVIPLMWQRSHSPGCRYGLGANCCQIHTACMFINIYEFQGNNW